MALRVTLPDNPTPEGINCVRIYYPDDPGFLTAVLSVVRYLENWYAWERDDAKQGKDAAASFRRASLYTVRDILAGISCGDCGDDGTGSGEPDISDILAACGGLIVLEDEGDMGQVVTNVEIVGGTLKVYFGPCCVQEYSLSDLCCEGPVIPDNPLDDPDDPTQVWSACGKAYTVIHALADGIQAGLDNYTSPVSFYGAIEDAIPTAGMGKINLSLLLFDYTTITKVVSNDSIINDVLVDTMVCVAAEGFENTSGVSDEEYTHLWYSVRFAIESSGINFASAQLVWALWEQLMQTVGEGDLKELMQFGAADNTQDCSCPLEAGEPTEPTENGWYLSQEYEVTATATGVYNTKACLRQQCLEDVFGVVFRAEWTAADPWNLKRMGSASAECDTADQTAWGDTSDHLEYDPQGTYYGCGDTTVLDEVVGSGLYEQKTSNYGTPTNPASPTWAAGTVISHGFYGDDMSAGEQYTIRLRFIHNINSPSH